MLKPSWIHFLGHRSRGGNGRPTTLRRTVRLCAERLEDRCLMSVNRAAGAAEQGTLASDLPSATIADQVVSASAHIDADSTAAGQSADATWERFSSKKELRTWLIEAAAAEWSHLFGRPTYSHYFRTFDTLDDSIALREARLTAFAVANDLDASFSATNLQVEGVDEADLVETDGNFLYIISGQDMVIVSVGEGEDFKVMCACIWKSGRLACTWPAIGWQSFRHRLGITGVPRFVHLQ